MGSKYCVAPATVSRTFEVMLRGSPGADAIVLKVNWIEKVRETILELFMRRYCMNHEVITTVII
jgi:hypothetical protein